MESMKTVVVYHEYGSKAHYLALECLVNSRGGNVIYREFRFLRQFLKGIYRKDIEILKKSLVNFMFFLKLLVNGGGGYNLVIGIAPYDWRAIGVKFLVRNSAYSLHTSWPYWYGGYTPKKSYNVFKGVWLSFLEGANNIFCVTNAVKDNISKNRPELKGKCHVVYHSLAKPFSSKPNSFELSEKIKICFVGRVVPEKGVFEFLELAKGCVDVDFYIVGNGNVEVCLPPNVHILPFINSKKEMCRFYRSMDILLLPSKKTHNWQDVFGIVIIEALSQGVYPVVTDHVGPSELIKRTVGLCLDESGYVEQAERFIQRYKGSSTESRLDLKRSCVSSVESFDLEALSRNWLPLLERDIC